jgi:hypothetical protein
MPREWCEICDLLVELILNCQRPELIEKLGRWISSRLRFGKRFE